MNRRHEIQFIPDEQAAFLSQPVLYCEPGLKGQSLVVVTQLTFAPSTALTPVKSIAV